TLYISSLGDGIYKTKDEGGSWKKVNHGLGTLRIDLIAVSTDSDDMVLAAGAGKGLYITYNGGASWTSVPGIKGKVTAMAPFSRAEKNLIVGDDRGALFASDDGGYNWKKLTSIYEGGAIRSIAVATDPTAGRILFVGTEKQGIYKITAQSGAPVEINRGISDKSILSIALSPGFPADATLYASTWRKGVFRSQDGGKSWKKYSEGLTTNAQADRPRFRRPHFSALKIVNGPAPHKTLFLCGFNGLFTRVDREKEVWEEIETLSTAIVEGLDISPDYGNDSQIVISTYLQGPHISRNGGVTWEPINKGFINHKHPERNIRIFEILFSPTYRDDRALFVTSWNHLWRSTNSG
ncbi:TPA: glycosyl hydrolase, partial [Candidatus Micrarchaeota archaeon]|nr:glycosyl hydrolase [Candidatus Micrarchaeota archaeon]